MSNNQRYKIEVSFIYFIRRYNVIGTLKYTKTLSGRKSSVLQSTSHSIHLGFTDKMTSVGDIKNLQIVKKASILGCTSRANAL